MPYFCDRCGLGSAESTCSANATYICVGSTPLAGCGHVLNPEERHYYGSCCESCAQAWSDVIDAWRAGADNADLDKMFELAKESRH